MSRRLPMTAIDYVAMALAPALIMVLVASLVFALVAFGYQGEFPERLVFCLAMFVLGSVCIARISIEISSEHAAIYALAFAGVVGCAMIRFGGGPWWMSLGLMAVVWYCAHQLTWDCTVVDDTEDASGEGLLQTAGIDKGPAVAAARPKTAKQARRSSRRRRAAPVRADEGTTARSARPSWRERWRAARERPHAHGVWVVYFSLAALPIFGLGQLAIPEADLGSRRTVFALLAAYLGAALGLLLITSFLGLRRYLRQRKIAMPAAVVVSWVTVGTLIALAVLAVAAMLPRPSPEYTLADVAQRLGAVPRRAPATPEQPASSAELASPEESASPEHSASPAEPVGPGQPASTSPSNAAAPSGARPSGKAAESSSQRDTPPRAVEREQQPATASTGENTTPGQSTSGSAPPSASASASQLPASTPPPDGKLPAPGDRQSADRAAAEPNATASTSTSRPVPPLDQRPDAAGESESKAVQGAASANAADTAGAPADKSEPDAAKGVAAKPPVELPPPVAAGGWLEGLVWAVYGLVGLAALYSAWRFRERVLAALSDFLASWRDFFRGLFGGRSESDDGDEDEPRRARPFSSFSDPFASGAAAQWDARQIVRYSFEALEAWAQEHGLPRQPEQTPLEFVRGVGLRAPTLARPSLYLADCYNRLAYAGAVLPPGAAGQLRQFWLAIDACVMPPALPAVGR